MSTTVIIDYGFGNIGSVAGALEHLGYPAIVSDDPDFIRNQDSLILPGVGSFFSAMSALRETGLDQSLRYAVLEHGAKILGICLGMQLLAEFGTEGGGTKGLGLAPGKVDRFASGESDSKELHIGFSGVNHQSSGQLLEGIPSGTDFYFVHEYRLSPDSYDSSWTLGLADHSERFVAVFERGNVFGVQFHPEKSQTNGLALLNNFLEA